MPVSYHVYQINEYFGTNITNYEQLNQFKLVLNECLNNATKKAVDLQYNTLNAAFSIGGNFQQLSKCAALIESQIAESHGKITKLYLNITYLNKREILEMSFKLQKVFANMSIILTNETVSAVTEDVLIILNTNNIAKCVYNKALNATIGSYDWIIHKTRHSTGWIRYRLSDMIYHKQYREDEQGYQYHKFNFPNSIAVHYMELIDKNNKNIDLPLLLRIMSTRKQLYPSNNTLVIHLRTGDLLDEVCVWNVVTKTKRKSSMSRFLSDPIGVLSEYLTQFRNHNISEVVIVTGFHIDADHTNSANYIIKIEQWFKLENFTVSFRVNENPDEDFLFMCNSKFFFQAPGGFSTLISKIVTMRKGILFNNYISWLHKNSAKEKQNCLDRF